MDARTTEQITEDQAAPAVVVRVAAQVGQNRSVDMQFAVPLDMTLQDVNAYMDKITSVMDRQNNKGLLEVAKASLEAAKKQLMTNLEQRTNYYNKCEDDFTLSNRKGTFRATESQRAQLGNFDSTTRNLKENIIPKFEKDIEELERKINEGV
jgi:exonuclease VII large subunit